MANPMRPETHRTTLNLPAELLRAAEEELGTTSPTVAVTTALREFVRRRAMERLLAMDLPDLTPEAVEAMRQPRSFSE
jgi:Arc/MetJ family transcription regulator